MIKNLVSILIPVYNRVSLVSETIDSAINQTYKNIEIIIVDNCSTDGTWELLQKHIKIDSRIRLFRNNENIGPVRNWERCIQEAKGEYAKILFSDDLIKDTFIEKTIQMFDNETAFVLTSTEVFGSKNNCGNLCFKKSEYSSKEYLHEILLYETINFPVSPGCALFRLIDLKEALLVDIPNCLNLEFSKFGAGNDLLLFLITATKYPKINVVTDVESFFRAHENSFSISNNLDTYYSHSKYYFITNYFKLILSKYEVKNSITSIYKEKTISIKNIRNILLNIPFCFKYILRKKFKFLKIEI